MNKAKLTVLALSMSSISVGVYAQSSTSPLTLQDIQKQHTAQSQRLDNYGLLISNNLGLVNKANQDIQQVKSQQDQTQHSLSQLGKNILSSAVYQHDLDAKQDSKIASNQKNVQQLQAQVGADVARLMTHEQLIKANQQVSVTNQQAILANQKQNTQQAKGIISNQQGIQQLQTQVGADVARLTTHEQLIKANQQVSVTNQQAILANQKQNTQQAKGIISNQQGIQQLQTQAGTDVARLTTHEQLIKANQQVSVKNQQAILANQKQNTQQAKGITSNQQGVQQLQSQQAKLEQTSITNNSLIVSNQQDVTQLQQSNKKIY
ncbi:hypothetical protein ACU5DF_21360 [Aliivibrio wodanis]|uniref:hypothetical protein n=1 Tax=Aliivibrio wodanis TaxID=80852 RepID=UPI00406CC1A9